MIARDELGDVLDNLDCAVWVADSSYSKILYVNETVRRYTGYAPADFLNDFNLWCSLCHPDDLAALMSLDEQLQTEPEANVEYRIIHKDGTIRWIHDRVIRGRTEPRNFYGFACDVTKRRMAEESALLNRERLNLVLDSDDRGIYVWNVRDGQMQWSSGIYRMVGVNPATHVPSARDWVARIHPDDFDACMRKVELLHTGTSDSIVLEYRVRHADGLYRCLLEHAYVELRDQDHRVQRIVGVTIDITGQREQQDRIAASESRLQLALDTLRAGFWEWNRDTEELLWSTKLRELVDLSAEAEVTLALWHDLIYDADRARFSEQMALLEGDQVSRIDLEFRMRTPAGDYRWVRTTGTVAMRDGRGKPVRLSGLAYDVTKRVEEAVSIREREERHRALLEGFPDTVLVSDPNEIIVDLHVGWAAKLGLGAEGGMGRGIRDLFPSVTADEILESIRACRRLAEPVTVEVEMPSHRAGERPEWLEVRSLLLPDLNVQTVVRNVSDRVRAYENRRRADELRMEAQKLESLRVLAGGIAHDFNNLLTAIIGNIDLALVDVSNHAAAEPLRDASQASHRAAVQVGKLLAYTGRGDLVRGPVDLVQVLRRLFSKSGWDWTGGRPWQLVMADSVALVVADERQVCQAIEALIQNAREALQDNSGGTITVSLALVGLADPMRTADPERPLQVGQYWTVEVRDTGAGMDPATLSRATEPFFTTRFPGRGLGLAAVMGIARAHAGGLVMESAPGKGTRARLYLPQADSVRRPGDSH